MSNVAIITNSNCGKNSDFIANALDSAINKYATEMLTTFSEVLC